MNDAPKVHRELDLDSMSAIRPARGLHRRTQWIIIGGLATGLILVAMAVALADTAVPPPRADLAAPPAAEAGRFRPTQTQWSTLRVATVATRNFRSEQITDGRIAIDADLTTPVYSPYSGRVTRVIAKPGELVHQGQPLFAIEASEFVQGQNDLISALAAAGAARMQLGVAETNEKRQHALYDAKAGALKDWQQSEADRATADANARTAEIALAAVRNRLRILGKSDREVTALETVGKMNPEALVTAPITGTVTDRQIGPGEYIQSGAAAPQYTIGDLSTVWLIANVRETDTPAMRLGDPVEVGVLALPGRVFKAKLAYIAPSVDPATRRVAVRAEVENADGVLKPEMFASFSIFTSAETAAPAMPAEGVIYEGDTARVWVAHDDGTVELRAVKTGRSSGGLVEILAGLAPGEKIVTSGALFIDRAATAD